MGSTLGFAISASTPEAQMHNKFEMDRTPVIAEVFQPDGSHKIIRGPRD